MVAKQNGRKSGNSAGIDFGSLAEKESGERREAQDG
jgi:hypothetical protein